MDFEALRAFCLSFPGATEEVQWGSDLLFKVGGKTFVFTGFNPPYPLSIKCSDEDFDALLEIEGIKQAPYLARHKWVALEGTSTLPRKKLESYIRKSYDAVFAKLTKKIQRNLDDADSGD